MENYDGRFNRYGELFGPSLNYFFILFFWRINFFSKFGDFFSNPLNGGS